MNSGGKLALAAVRLAVGGQAANYYATTGMCGARGAIAMLGTLRLLIRASRDACEEDIPSIVRAFALEDAIAAQAAGA
jgi:hypothetical protein